MDLKELIDDYLEGKLSPKDMKLFEDLIAGNPQYKAELAEQESGKAAMKMVEKRSQGATLRSWGFSTLIAVVIVAVGYLLWITLGMSPGEKLYAKYYETPTRLAQPSIADTDESELISEAFKAYDKGDFKKAASLFEQFQMGPDSDYILFYFGICHLELGRPEKAIPLFDLVNSGTDSEETASWFAALGYFKLDMMDEAVKSLQITAASPNSHQDPARDILKSLE